MLKKVVYGILSQWVNSLPLQAVYEGYVEIAEVPSNKDLKVHQDDQKSPILPETRNSFHTTSSASICLSNRSVQTALLLLIIDKKRKAIVFHYTYTKKYFILLEIKFILQSPY